MSGLGRLVRDAAAALAAAGVPSPHADAEILAAAVFAVPRGRLAAVAGACGPGGGCDPGLVDAYQRAVARRASREPLQHITGRAPFRYLDLAVGPGVFVPRPETEVVVEDCLARLRARSGPAPVVVDLCAGSGAIALALATEHPGASVHAVEREPDAFAYLTRNVEEHTARTGAAGSSVRCLLADVADLPVRHPELLGAVDLVVSNPPYVPLGARPLEPEVAEHDPPAALWAGGDGLETVRVVVAVARRLLRPGGYVAIEHADNQRVAVTALLAGAGWTQVADHPDLAGRDRFATAERAPDAGPDEGDWTGAHDLRLRRPAGSG